MRFPSRPSKRSLRANALWLQGDVAGLQALATNAPKPRQSRPRAEREAGAMDAIKEWRRLRGDVTIYRNNVGACPTSGGGWLQYGLCKGSADFVGYRSVVVSPDMVGKRLAVFLAIEAKAPDKGAESHQETWLKEVTNAGGIAGVARNAAEAEALLLEWENGGSGE